MSTMIAEVYDALKEAGASEEKAKAAAMALADYRNRFDRIDFDLGSLKGDLPIVKADLAALKTDLAVVQAELAMVKWIVSGVGFGVLLLVLRSFWPG
jgi:capsule polysaccharide export protein KpsE/RkpR